MRFAYTVPGAPASTAFTPVPAVNASVLGYKYALSGQPGTEGIPTDQPGLTTDVNGTRINSGYAGGTKNMPMVWYPQLYFQRTAALPGEYFAGISIFSDNQMPIPAADPRGRAAIMAKPPTFMGTKQVKARRAFPRWSDWLPLPDFGS